MRGFLKADVGPKGEAINFHCITKADIDFSLLPDAEGQGGSMSTVRISSFTSLDFYDANRGNAELAVKHRFYAVDLLSIAAMVRMPDGVKSVETKAYEAVVAQDPWFSDATVVE
jgi:hypothetical protein